MAEPFNNIDTVRKTYFINESERSVDPADDAGKVPQLEADGKISGKFLREANIVPYTASGTWTKPNGLRYIIVEGVGGGGGGGGGSSTTAKGGGGGGGYFRKKISAQDLASTVSVTIGAGGSPHNVGGASSFGSHATANGGASPGTTVGPRELGAAGGTATGGDVNIAGEDGRNGITTIISGDGGASFFGTSVNGISVNGNGLTGKVYGGGGSGCKDNNTGGAGAPGIIIVTEFY